MTRAYPGVFKGTVEAVLDGFHREWEVEVKKSDTWSHDFTLTAATPRAAFHLELDEKTANLFTDCAVNILDGDGKAVVQTSFDGLEADVEASLPEGVTEASFKLQVVGAFALAEDTADWGFDAEETYLFAAPSRAEVEARRRRRAAPVLRRADGDRDLVPRHLAGGARQDGLRGQGAVPGPEPRRQGCPATRPADWCWRCRSGWRTEARAE